MANCVVSETIAAPIDRVFALFSDIPNAARHISGIREVEMLTEPPVGQSTRWRETRLFHGKEAVETLEITDYDAPYSYSVEANSHGAKYISAFTFKSVDAGTAVSMSFSVFPQTWLAKIMNLVMGRMMQKAVKSCMQDDIRDLKRIAEQ